MTDPIAMKKQLNEELSGELLDSVSGFICPFTGVPCTTIPMGPRQDTNSKQENTNSKVS